MATVRTPDIRRKQKNSIIITGTNTRNRESEQKILK